ncbi:MAG: DUF4179 domain-containing protein [Alicyclobacillus sp.]|nr:DUF4179 domain-containing protein [Alicyclobacillus sp.]
MKPSYTPLEERLRKYYQDEVRDAKLPNLWAGIEQQLGVPDVAAGNSRQAIRWRRWVLRWAAGISCAAVLSAGFYYVAPRWAGDAYALVSGQANDDQGAGILLRSDPGLFSLFQQKAFQPVQLAVTHDGITLRVLDLYADGTRTVVLYQVDGPAAPKGSIMTVPWQVMFNNLMEVSNTQLSNQPAPKVHTYAVTLRDQFGIAHRATKMETLGPYGYLEFPAFPALIRQMGLRLTLHVEAIGRTLAEHGPFGERTFQTVTGPWDIPFVALPDTRPLLQLTPGIRAINGGAALTLTSVRVSDSMTQVTLSANGFPADTIVRSLQIRLQRPDGSIVQPTNQSRTDSSITLEFPPMHQAGIYTLAAEVNGVTWHLPWNQPAWSGNTSAWQPSRGDEAIYTGTDLAAAAALSGLSVHQVPAGWHLQQVAVYPDFRPPLSGDPGSTPYSVQLTLTNDNGVQVRVSEARTLWSPIPPVESLASYRAEVAKSSGSDLDGPEIGEWNGMTTHLWVVRTPNPGSTQTLELPLLYVYPTWGSVEVSPVPGQTKGMDKAALQDLVVGLAHTWLEAPLVTPAPQPNP